MILLKMIFFNHEGERISFQLLGPRQDKDFLEEFIPVVGRVYNLEVFVYLSQLDLDNNQPAFSV